MMSSSGKEQQQVRLQRGKDAWVQLERLDLGDSVRAEAHVVEAAKGSGILILLAYVPPQSNARDAEGALREIVLGQWTTQMSGKHFQEIHTNASGRAQAGAGGDFGGQEQIGGEVCAQILEHGERNFQTAVLGRQRGEVAPVP